MLVVDARILKHGVAQIRRGVVASVAGRIQRPAFRALCCIQVSFAGREAGDEEVGWEKLRQARCLP